MDPESKGGDEREELRTRDELVPNLSWSGSSETARRGDFVGSVLGSGREFKWEAAGSARSGKGVFFAFEACG